MKYLGKDVAAGTSKDGTYTTDDLIVGQQTDSTAVFSSATNYNEGSVVGSTILAPHINYILFPVYLAVFASDMKTNLEIIKKKYRAAESLIKTIESFGKDVEAGKKAKIVNSSREVG
jgi:hypothetical protein